MTDTADAYGDAAIEMMMGLAKRGRGAAADWELKMTSRSTALARAEGRIRQLCCLGLSGPVLAPWLFRELNAAVPFETCVHIWLGPTGPSDAYFNAPEIGGSLRL